MAQKGLWNIAKKRMLEELCPEKTETYSVNTKPYMKKTFSAVGCTRNANKRRGRG